MNKNVFRFLLVEPNDVKEGSETGVLVEPSATSTMQRMKCLILTHNICTVFTTRQKEASVFVIGFMLQRVIGCDPSVHFLLASQNNLLEGFEKNLDMI